MKISVTFLYAIIAVSATLTAVSCSSDKSAGQETATQEITAISVDSLLADADALVGDTILIEGTCSHLCKHGGRKAFILSNDSSQVLRCEATSAIGGAFSPDCVGHKLTISGVVRENRIGEKEIADMEAQQAKTDGSTDHACSTDAKAHGQDSISEFDARMADYRQRISKRMADEGKDYLSFYYLEAISYGIEE